MLAFPFFFHVLAFGEAEFQETNSAKFEATSPENDHPHAEREREIAPPQRIADADEPTENHATEVQGSLEVLEVSAASGRAFRLASMLLITFIVIGGVLYAIVMTWRRNCSLILSDDALPFVPAGLRRRSVRRSPLNKA
jgi:hypothetical protein